MLSQHNLIIAALSVFAIHSIMGYKTIFDHIVQELGYPLEDGEYMRSTLVFIFASSTLVCSIYDMLTGNRDIPHAKD
jgi:hypothetical protein